MCNELQVAAFQISRAETDLTPGTIASPGSSIQVTMAPENDNEEKAQRPPLQRVLTDDGGGPTVHGATDPRGTLCGIIVNI